MNRQQALTITEQFVKLIETHCERLEIAGSIRRGKSSVHDAEVVIMPNRHLFAVLDMMVIGKDIRKARYGEKQLPRWGDRYRGLVYHGLLIELFFAHENNWGYTLWLRTGPGDANKWLMNHLIAVNAPVRARNGEWWHGDQQLAIPTERDLFALLGLPEMPPAMRTEARYRRYLKAPDHAFPDPSPWYAPNPLEQMRMF